MSDYLKREDYEEPCCILNMHAETVSVPIGRIIGKLDSFLTKNDYEAAQNHLAYWLKEAENCGDMRAKLTILNEQAGLYRKLGKKSEALAAVRQLTLLIDLPEFNNTVTQGTALINMATVFNAFGKPDEALALYEKAKEIYETYLKSSDERLGGLYNNMGLALSQLGCYDRARELFNDAIGIMLLQPHGEAETAITFLNLADTSAAQSGIEAACEEIGEYLAQAEKLLFSEGIPQDGAYAYACEKCAPVFGYYGYFAVENELNERAKSIYERS